MPDRAVLFVDGSNFYHGLKRLGVLYQRDLSYRMIFEKLCGPRTWLGTRYYVAALKQEGNTKLYSDQRSFLKALENEDSRISVHLGRLEKNKTDNLLVPELRELIDKNRSGIDQEVRNDMFRLISKHANIEVWREKAVDVRLAMDMVMMAAKDEYDSAYLLSADGDFTPPVLEARKLGKKVYSVSPQGLYSSALARVSQSFIALDKNWFKDCYL